MTNHTNLVPFFAHARTKAPCPFTPAPCPFTPAPLVRHTITDISYDLHAVVSVIPYSFCRAWYVPDRLTFCWRHAVLNCHYSDGVVESIRNQNIEWTIRLRRIMNDARRLHDSIDDIEDGWLEFFTVFSLQHWNGFCHVQAMASPQARTVFRKLVCSSADDIMACTDDYECDVEGSEYLRTVCCFIQSLRFYGYDKSAATLAVQAIICYLPVLSLSADVSSVTNGLLNAIRKCHNETGVHLWGEDDSGDDDDDDHSRDPILLCTLLQAVVHDDNSWEICCNTPLTCSSDSESDENCDFPYSDTVSLPLPVYVLLECIKSIPDGFQVDSIGQVRWLVCSYPTFNASALFSSTSSLNSTSCLLAQQTVLNPSVLTKS